MKINPLLSLQRLKAWQLGLFLVILSILLTELIVTIMSLLLKGAVLFDYLLTGLVASFFVATPVITLVSYLLKQLTMSQSQLKATLDAIPDLLFEVDLEGRYYAYYTHRSNSLAMPPEQVLGKKVSEILPADAAETIMAALQEAAQQGWATSKQIQLEVAQRKLWFEFSIAIKRIEQEGLPHFIVVSRDITERKLIERQLQESEERLNLSQEYGGIGSWEMDLIHNRQFWSRTTYQLFNLAVLENPNWNDFLATVHRDDKVIVIDAIRAHFTRQEKKYDVEYRVLLTEGEIRWIHSAGRADFTPDGTPIRFMGIVQDITEHKRIESEILSTKNQLQATLDAIPDLLFEVDLEGRYYDYYAQRAELLAAPPEHLLGKKITDVLPPDAAATCLLALQEAKQQGWSTGKQIQLELAEGVFWFELSVAIKPTDNEQLPHFIMLSRNITERKQIEKELEESELMLKEAQEIAHLGHWILDIPSNKLYWSDEIYRIFGVLPQEFGASYEAFLGYIHPEDRSYVKYSYSCHLISKANYEIEHRVLLKDGTVKYVLEKCKTEFNQRNEPLRSVGVVLDITRRKRAEELLDEKTQALLRSNADLEQFAYSVSHDMRQPLRSVIGHLQLLARSLKDKLDNDERENLAFALDGGKRMDAMILSLLEYSRVGQKTETKTWVSSQVALDEALEFLNPAIKEANAQIKISGDWGLVFAVQDELTRLFMNLIGNAIKYREANQSACVDVHSTVTVDTWKVSIRDYGIGINPQQIDRLFQFFSRLQSRTRFEGTGMGLALCRRIVEHHGGRIWVESAGEGQGCCFIFELPLNNHP